MRRINCLAGNCAYNTGGLCGRADIRMSAKEGGAECHTYERGLLKKYDMEASAFGTDIVCSAESCAYNVHYICKAGMIQVSAKDEACVSYKEI